MKKLLTLLAFSTLSASYAQIDTLKQEMVAMKDTREKPYKVGSVYYKKDAKTPFTGVLFGKYANGNYLTLQEYKAGVGNGKWINYYPDGAIKEIGTYRDNYVEGPITQYYENGYKKAEGTYKHWKKKIGLWKFYSEEGVLVRTKQYD